MSTQLEKDILGDLADCGFSLREPDDHILELYYGEKVIARFSQEAITENKFPTIREGCRNYLKNTASK